MAHYLSSALAPTRQCATCSVELIDGSRQCVRCKVTDEQAARALELRREVVTNILGGILTDGGLRTARRVGNTDESITQFGNFRDDSVPHGTFTVIGDADGFTINLKVNHVGLNAAANTLAAFTGHTPKQARLEALTRAGSVQTFAPPSTEQKVRERQAHGPCRVLGTLLRETATGLVYRAANGKAKVAKKSAKPRSAGSPYPTPHAIPCLNCEDHSDSNFGPGRCSVHGRPQPCTTCMET